MSPYGYTNQEHLSDTALIHMNGRVYDPQISKFTSSDPMIGQQYSTQGWNRYAYVGGNPLNSTDPTGMTAVPDLSFLSDPAWRSEVVSAGLAETDPMSGGNPLGFISEYVGFASHMDSSSSCDSCGPTLDGNDPATQAFNQSGLSYSDYTSITASNNAVISGAINTDTAIRSSLSDPSTGSAPAAANTASAGTGGGPQRSQSNQPGSNATTDAGGTWQCSDGVCSGGERFTVPASNSSGFIPVYDSGLPPGGGGPGPNGGNVCLQAMSVCVGNAGKLYDTDQNAGRERYSACTVALRDCNNALREYQRSPDTIGAIRFPGAGTVWFFPFIRPYFREDLGE